MILNELDSKTKCVCKSCDGTGVFTGFAEREGLGVVCYWCNGKGYYTFEQDKNTKIVKDAETGNIYTMINGEIDDSLCLFEKLNVREDVSYVMYGTDRMFNPSFLFENGATEINVITYKEFLEGKLPLPMAKYVCLRQLSKSY